MEYGCIGERLSHSFSPEIHKRLFDYKYELKELEKNELEQFLTEKNFKAINVTIPYKQAVIPFLDSISEVAKSIGAVNTIVNENGKLCGFNTDFSGMCAMIKKAGIELSGKKTLILGSGGTSKTALAAARFLNAGEIYRVSRKDEKDCITYDKAINNHNDAEIIINTTPCGMFPDINKSAVDISAFDKLCGVVDAVYNPLCSKLILDAKKRKIKATGGLYMLVSQAAFAAEKFTGKKVDEEKTDRIYSEILRDKKNIVLVGMPGSGKSTVGKILANKCKMNFVDTDEVIAENEGMSIPDIFAKYSENYFRSAETRAVKEVSVLQHTVISTGGGAILKEENIDLLKANGTIYFIDRPIEKIAATADRPLSSNKDDLYKRFSERYDKYKACADVIVNADCMPNQVAKAVKEDFLK